MTEDYDIEEIKRERQRGFQPKNCFEIVNRSRWAMAIMLMVALPVLFVFSYSVYNGTSAVIDIRVNTNDINVTPIKPIQIERDISTTVRGRFAYTNNATFRPFAVSVGILYDKTEQLFRHEYLLAQYPDRIINDDLKAAFDDLNDSRDFSFSSAMVIVKNDSDSAIKMRISSDYFISVRLVVLVDFILPSENDVYITFYYIVNHGVFDNENRPIGRATFGLVNSKTFILNIDNIYYDYKYISSFFSYVWSNEANIPPYPFILNGTQQLKFVWNDFWGAK